MVFANSQDLTYGYGVFDTYGTSSSTGTTSATNSQSYTISSPEGVITVGGATYLPYEAFSFSNNEVTRIITTSGTAAHCFVNNYATSGISCGNYSYTGLMYVGENEEVKKERERKDREEERLKKNALFRGTKLLESLLPQLEYKRFKETKALEVVTNDFLYKLKLGEKVRRISKITGKEERLCIVPQAGKLPDIDKLIGFKLLIEADEEYFNKTANVLNW